ncbi:MAG: iron transporter [Hyphomicrobium sp.]|nr:iron transporter [Hyphomicrobium sp.]
MSRNPSGQPSDEADKKQLEMAKEEGEAYHRSLLYMANEVADTGGQQHCGDYIVAYALEKAEGMYVLHSEGKFEWVEPSEENCHLEISVSDAGDKRFIPHLYIEARLTASDGEQMGPFEMPFLWHPGLFHYGRNIRVPGAGCYTLHVRIAPPHFMRHDRTNGQRYAHTVCAEFKQVPIKTGQE